MTESLGALSLTEDDISHIYMENEIEEDEKKIKRELPQLERSLLSNMPVTFDTSVLYSRLEGMLGIDLFDVDLDRLMKNLLKYMVICKPGNRVVWKALNVIYSHAHFRKNGGLRSDKYDLARNLTARLIGEDTNEKARTKVVHYVRDFVYKNRFSEEEARKL